MLELKKSQAAYESYKTIAKANKKELKWEQAEFGDNSDDYTDKLNSEQASDTGMGQAIAPSSVSTEGMMIGTVDQKLEPNDDEEITGVLYFLK